MIFFFFLEKNTAKPPKHHKIFTIDYNYMKMIFFAYLDDIQ